MNNKTMLWTVVAIVVIVGGIYLVTRTPSGTSTDTSSNPTTQNGQQAAASSGHAVFSVTDAAVNMSSISEINMQVKSVEVHSQDTGWITVSSTPHTYSLLQLNAKNESDLLADTNLKAGTYDQIRLMVDSVSVKTTAGAVKTAKVPSGELRINTKLVISPNSTTSANFDFMASKSIHTTGSGAYIFAPVVKTETKSGADVNVNGDSSVTIVGGHIDNSNTVGMDLDGSVKLNFQIDDSQKFEINTDGSINVGGTTILK